MKTLLPRSLALLILQAAFVLSAHAQVRYQVVDLGVPDFTGVLVESGVHDARVTNVAATGINEHGVVVGTYNIEYKYVHNGQTHSRSLTRGFRWENGQFTDLGALYSAQYTGSTWAADINEQGEIAGTSNMGPMETSPGSGNFVYPSHAYRSSGAPTDLGTDTQPWHGSSAAAINNSGVVVGSTGGYSDYAAKWEGGTIWRLPALVSAHKAVANGINDAGLIVGQSIDAISWRSKAVLWRPGQAAESLDPTPINQQESEAVDINEQGRIVGAVRQGTAWLPVRWESGQQTFLFAHVPSGGARPGAVNNLGHVVGSMSYSLPGSFGRWHAFIWTDALNNPAMMAPHYELDRMIPPNTGWELWYAADINDRGYIVGSGKRNGKDRAFLLIPDDDPTADIDADSNKDGLIDDNDDGIELSTSDAAIIKPNIDDSDADGVLDSDNDVLEGNRGKYSKLIVRRPPTVAPTLVGEARLKTVAGSGPGKIRVFLDDVAGTMVLGPNQTQGADFWAQLATGDLNLLAEGVEKGQLYLELEVVVNGNRHTDRIALVVPQFKLELQADEPFLDVDGDPFATGFLEVPADFVAEDYQGIESAGALNLFVRLYREDEPGSDEEPPDREIKWKVEPTGANQVATQPGLRDLIRATGFQPEVTALVRGHFSRTQLRFSFPHPAEIDAATGQPRQWVKAGDTFKITATLALPGGRTLTKERSVRIVPGAKFFHVTEPASGVQPDTLWRLSDSQFEQQLAGPQFQPPMKSAETKFLSVLLLDQYRNPLAAGTEIKLRLEGSGYLGMLNTGADAPDTDAASTALVGAGGLAQIRMTQTSFASCPWQPAQELDDGVGIVGLFPTRTDPLARSMLKRDAAFPPALGRVRLRARTPTVTAGFVTPDIYQRHTREFEVEAYYEATGATLETKVVGAQVSFSSLNGKLKLDPITATTDSGGVAKVTLTHENARPDEEIRVIAQLADHSVTISYPGMRWISSAPTVVKPEHRFLAGDQTANGTVYVETLDDTGEALAFPGAVEGDGWLGIPYYTRSRVDVTGIPGHVYKVDIADGVSWLLSARFPLDDALAQQTTPDVRGGLDARYSNTTLDLVEKKEGAGSFAFNANGLVTVPGSAAVELANGLLIELWANPASGHRGVLLERAGQYKLELIDSGPQLGHVRLRIEGRNAAGLPVNHDLVSARPLPAGQWSFVEARYDGTSIRLGVGAEKDRLEMAFRTFPAVQPVAAGTPVLVGTGYVGRMDDLRFTTGGNAPRIAIATGVQPDGTLVLDQNGRGHFFVESTGNWNPDRYLPALVMVELSGSEKAAGEVQFTHSNIIGQLIAGGKAFLLGTESLGKDAGWFARATAWASENLPLLSDLRTLAMELYKAGSGCDKVSMMNVTFAAVGVVADVATFGTAGAGVRGMAATLKVAAKAFLKEFAQNTAMAALAQQAISAYMRELTLQTAASGQGSPPGWVLQSSQFMGSLTTWAQQGLASALDNSLTGLESMLGWSAIYKELTAAETQRMLEGIKTLGAELETIP